MTPLVSLVYIIPYLMVPLIFYVYYTTQIITSLQGMVLGLKALVAAGAESVMVLYTGRQATFRPRRSSTGLLMNTCEFEQYLTHVQLQGRDVEIVPCLSLSALL